jgi:SSS family solute:Na+ symporter|tara:strand:+ start:1501 stop:2865 length:1365 start_codon:yes stop_codon:yes gene_type:complete
VNNFLAYGLVLTVLFLIYLRTTKIESSDKEYFVLDRTEGVFGLSLSFYASGMGLWILTSPAEVAWYGLGFDIFGYALSAATPFILIYFFGPKIASLTPEGATLPQFIEKRYGSSAQKVVSIVAVVYMTAFLIAEFASINFIFPEIVEVSGLVISILIGFATFLYLSKSGFKASYVTDKFQGVGIIALLSVLFTVWFSQNSISDLIEYSKLGGITSFESFSFKSALAVVVAVTAAEIFSQGYWQRTFSAENAKSLKSASVYAGLGCFITILLLGIAGAVGAGKGIESPTLSFIQQLELSIPMALLLLLLCTLLVASSVDTLENAISSTISLDLVKKGISEARVITAGIVIFSILCSIYVSNIFNVFLVADLFAVCLVFPTFYKLKNNSSGSYLLVPFFISLSSVYSYRFFFIDVDINPGGIFIPTDAYGLADLNTFLVGLVSSMLITLAYNKIIK